MTKKTKIGKVYIIGAGPGDAGLFTLAGVDRLRLADVVIYDNLVNEELLRYAAANARFVYAGKKGGNHTLSQEKINALLLAEALAGRIVARLKGGDPFIFGRGGEEAEMLASHDVPFEIIPGVTSAIAVPAYAGIPLTQRTATSTVAFVTGHEDPTKDKSDIDWQALTGIGTLVFLMGVKNLAQITQALIDHGKAPTTPVALIRRGTMPEQEVLVARLADIASRARSANFAPPAILVVGEVVKLRETLQWFEQKPLFGKGIVVTRPDKQAYDLGALLEREGARVFHFPTIKIGPPRNWRSLDTSINKLDTYNWIIFTSANGVQYFFERLFVLGKDIRDLRGIKICCIGPATAKQVQAKGIRVDLIPKQYISEGILQSFASINMRGQTVLIPRAAQARDILPDGLTKAGATVDVATAYETVGSEKKKKELRAMLAHNNIHVITFTSPSTVTNFLQIMGRGFSLPEEVKIACIGPVTAATANEAGLSVDIMQDEYTMEGLVQSLARYFKKKKTVTARGKNQ
jgi:uroporphyrinogen III methyltransferase / synthase